MAVLQEEEALKRLRDAHERVMKANEEFSAATAELARLQLLGFAVRNPEVKAFTFEVSWEYDDEGGYFPTVIVGAETDDGLETGAEDELLDFGPQITEDAANLLGTRRTVEELKEVKF